MDPAEDSTPSPRLETSDIAAKAMTLESLLSKDAPQKTFLPFLVAPVFCFFIPRIPQEVLFSPLSTENELVQFAPQNTQRRLYDLVRDSRKGL